jgi:hypothetical protein
LNLFGFLVDFTQQFRFPLAGLPENPIDFLIFRAMFLDFFVLSTEFVDIIPLLLLLNFSLLGFQILQGRDKKYLLEGFSN